jgi:hypothetical protein
MILSEFRCRFSAARSNAFIVAGPMSSNCLKAIFQGGPIVGGRPLDRADGDQIFRRSETTRYAKLGSHYVATFKFDLVK